MTLQQYFTQPTANTARTDLRPGLEARVRDPLWLLLRQWQMAEFQGEDAGSPVLARCERDSFRIDRVTLDGQAQAYSPTLAPLEAVVERETKEQVLPDLRTRAQAGRLFVRMLDQAGLALDVAAFTAQMAFVSAEFSEATARDAAARVFVERAPDARTIYAAFSTPLNDTQLAALLPGSAAPYAPYTALIGQWIAHYEARVGKPGERDAWIEERLEYSFSISVPTDAGRIELVAPEYDGGRLDWDAFEVASVDPNDTSASPERRTDTFLVSPVTYLGMPAPRFWQFEDARVDFGNTETSDSDLGRLLLAEFAMAWGNDWFLIPLELPLGALCRVNELRVTDTFGVTTRILPQLDHTPHWGLGRLAQRAGTPDLSRYLFVAPVLPTALEGAPIEEVRFVRDELANLAWAIEQRVATALGRPRHAADDAAGPRGAFERPRSDAAMRYRAITDLPEHWIPLLPIRDLVGGTRHLVRAGLLDELDEPAPEPAGALLSSSTNFWVHEEEISREGAVVTRAYQLTRWLDGQRSVWLGRRKRPGAGEMRSNLEFDRLLLDAGQS